MSEVKEMTKMQAIRTFFESDGGRKVTMQEMKDLTAEDRNELATAAAERLGVTLKEAK
jgi:hypothetical protein